VLGSTQHAEYLARDLGLLHIANECMQSSYCQLLQMQCAWSAADFGVRNVLLFYINPSFISTQVLYQPLLQEMHSLTQSCAHSGAPCWTACAPGAPCAACQSLPHQQPSLLVESTSSSARSVIQCSVLMRCRMLCGAMHLRQPGCYDVQLVVCSTVAPVVYLENQ
jgi:hypothetical protein